eukprot:11193402-Lingulodinium_polyedra.AAC.1
MESSSSEWLVLSGPLMFNLGFARGCLSSGVHGREFDLQGIARQQAQAERQGKFADGGVGS